jgi:DNA-binding HxlR family transcriptional regulator
MSWKDTLSQTGLTVKMAREIRSLVEGQEMTTTSIIKSLNDRGYRRVTRKGITNYLRELESEGIVQKMRSGSKLDRISYRGKN